MGVKSNLLVVGALKILVHTPCSDARLSELLLVELPLVGLGPVSSANISSIEGLVTPCGRYRIFCTRNLWNGHQVPGDLGPTFRTRHCCGHHALFHKRLAKVGTHGYSTGCCPIRRLLPHHLDEVAKVTVRITGIRIAELSCNIGCMRSFNFVLGVAHPLVVGPQYSIFSYYYSQISSSYLKVKVLVWMDIMQTDRSKCKNGLSL